MFQECPEDFEETDSNTTEEDFEEDLNHFFDTLEKELKEILEENPSLCPLVKNRLSSLNATLSKWSMPPM